MRIAPVRVIVPAFLVTALLLGLLSISQGEKIEFAATPGTVSPEIGTTDSEGRVSTTYTAPVVGVQTSVTATTHFADDTRYEASNASSSGTVTPKPIGLEKVVIKGASFAIPETLKDDVSFYRAAIPEEYLKLLPIPLPSEAFILATPENLSLVLAQESDKGMATVEGWPLSKNIILAGYELNVILADKVSIEKEGSPASVGEILSNPDDFRLDLVKVTATRRHASILYDPDDGSRIEFPVTDGYLVEKPKAVKSMMRKVIKKGGEIIKNPDPSLVKELLQTKKTRLPVFDFETDYWLSSSAETNGIVLSPGSEFIKLLRECVPELENLIQLEEGKPVLYDVKTSLIYEEVSSIDQVKKNPEQYRDRVIGFTARGLGAGISIQETIKATTEEDVPLDVRLEGLIAWNKLSVPPERKDFLLTTGASSIHQDEVYQNIKGRFKFVGRVRSTKEIDNSLPEAMALFIYSREKVGRIDYEAIAERAREIIENRIGELNLGLTGFIEWVPPGIPIRLPEISVGEPGELPETISVEKGINLYIQIVKPGTPVELNIVKSAVDGVSISVKSDVSGVGISIKKLLSTPPEVGIEPPGKAYRFIDISTENLREDSIENASITFWVLKEWLSTHGFSKDGVILQRYQAGSWENLPTEQIGENASHFKYSTRIPGFSTFAITASAKVVGAVGKQEEGLPISLIIVGVIIIIIIIAGIVAYRR